ncbi:membrane-associated protein, putative [Bodo saltans]|uniref:Membrane-associated protein, putative n=1 Tax=Bodo saltans TaxID=75058 RepID=A0A0S4IWK9_BODSA|nr:membrane-associated protein, putative [Bodo saltans]|eukprot:CUG05599.1 membrane-associated protein, putative [Bodo saltans]
MYCMGPCLRLGTTSSRASPSLPISLCASLFPSHFSTLTIADLLSRVAAGDSNVFFRAGVSWQLVFPRRRILLFSVVSTCAASPVAAPMLFVFLFSFPQFAGCPKQNVLRRLHCYTLSTS